MTEAHASGEAPQQQQEHEPANEARAVSDQETSNRPIGWWLKEADAEGRIAPRAAQQRAPQ